MVHDRPDCQTSPARVKLELVANGPDEVHCFRHYEVGDCDSG